MEYYAPEKQSESEITCAVQAAAQTEERINAVLSAIYFCGTEFSGQTLLAAIGTAPERDRIFLFRTVETFMRIHRTNILHGEFIAEMEKFSRINRAPHPELMELIDDVRELSGIFSGR